MADLHCHLLPGVDDGSRSVDQSLTVLALMRKQNISDVCLTPHLEISELAQEILDARLERHDAAYKELSSRAERLPRTHRGVELMVGSPLSTKAVVDHRVTLAGSRYILVEFHRDVSSAAIQGLVATFISRKVVPLIAHAERYAVASPQEVFRWRDQGAAIQVDAQTLAAGNGTRTARARALVENGLADIIAADNHGDERTLAAPWQYLCDIGADRQAEYLLRINPFAILSDQALEPVPALPTKRGLWASLVAFLHRH